jgi:broad specificity phosphatase PhoE
MTGEILALRHGATEWSAEGKHTGRTDIALTADGEQEAARLADLVAGRSFVLVLSSPLRRAHRTAQLAGLHNIEVDPDLVEWDYGGYEGLTTEEIRRTRPGWTLWRDGVIPRADGTPGESLTDVGLRADRIIARVLPALPSGDVALVAHGHFLRVLAARWLALSPTDGSLFALGTASVSVFGFEHGNRVVQHWNVVPGGLPDR